MISIDFINVWPDREGTDLPLFDMTLHDCELDIGLQVILLGIGFFLQISK